MRQTLRLFQIGLKQLSKDGMLLMLLPAPLLVGILFRFAIPVINNLLGNKVSFSLEPWYGIFDGILICLTPLFAAIVSSFLMLEERDEGIGAFYQITPTAGYSYLFARIGLPMIWAVLTTIINVFLFHISNLSPAAIILTSIVSTFMGIFFAMMIVSLANNRVEGLVFSKLTGFSLLGLIIVWFIPAPFQYFAAFLPSFWIGRLLMDGITLFTFAAGIISCFLLIGLFTIKFMRSID